LPCLFYLGKLSPKERRK